MTTIIIMASAFAYLAIGFWLGRRDLPRYIENQRLEWPATYGVTDFEREYGVDEDKTTKVYPAAAGWLVGWIILWPMFATVLFIRNTLISQVAALDPKAKDAEMAAMQKRISELEKELEIQ